MDAFDSLFFTESTLGDATMSGADLVIPIGGLFRLGESSQARADHPVSGRLIFKGAQRSVRKVTEYIGDPRRPGGFKEPRLEERDLAAASGDVHEYAFEGLQLAPMAWVDWTVTARAFEFVEDIQQQA
jgi:hypothetical protein